MRTSLAFLAAAMTLGGITPVIAADWTRAAAPATSLMAGTWVSDAGGDAAPSFGPGPASYGAGASAIVIIAEGDGYDVTPRALLGGQGGMQRTAAHDTGSAGASAVVIVAEGDGYDVTPRAFLGGQGEMPRTLADASLRTGMR